MLYMLTCAALSLAPQGESPPPTSAPDGWRSAVEEYLRLAAEAGEFSGVVLVSRDGERVFEGAFAAEGTVPLSVDDRFAVASISKSFAAACTHRLIRRELLSPDTRIGDLLVTHPDAASATVRDLLAHRAGLRG